MDHSINIIFILLFVGKRIRQAISLESVNRIYQELETIIEWNCEITKVISNKNISLLCLYAK
mgnify:FL=1